MRIGIGIGLGMTRGGGGAAPITVSIGGLTTNATYGPTAQYGTTLTAVVSGGAASSYGWLEGAVERASGETLNLTAGGDFGDLQTIYAFAVVDGVTYVSAGATIRYAAPTGLSSLSDITQTEGDPSQSVNVAAAVSGSALAYSVASNSLGVTVNPITGAATVPFNSIVAATVITYTATNSGGAISRAHSITINAVVPVTPTYGFTQGANSTFFISGNLPSSTTFTPVSGATGTMVSVTIAAVHVPSVTVNGVAAELVSAVSAYPSGVQVEYTFYSPETASPAVVSAPTASGNIILCVQVLSIAGGTIRSDVTNSFVPTSDPTGIPFTLDPIAVKAGDLVLIHIGGNNEQNHSIAYTGFTRIDTNVANLKNRMLVKAVTADETITFAAANWKTSTVWMAKVVVLSQYPAIVAIPTEPPLDGYIYALNQARTSTTIPVSGIYTGTDPASIQERVVNQDGTEIVGWTAVDAAPASGSYSGSLTVPVSGTDSLYRQARKGTDSATMRQTSAKFRAGQHMILSGQSNAARFATTLQSPPAVNGAAMVYNAATDSFMASSSVGNGLRVFMNDVVTNLSLPVLVIYAAQSGSPITAFVPGTPVYGYLSDAIAALDSTLHGMLWNQGEGDASGAGFSNAATYGAALDSIHGGLAALAGQTTADFPLLISSLGTRGLSVDEPFNSAAQWATFLDVQKDLPGLYPDIHFAECRLDMVRGGTAPASVDGYHMQGKSAEVSAKRLADFYTKLVNGSGTQNPWYITGAVATSTTTTTVTLTHALGTDFDVKLLPHGDGIGLLTAGTTIEGFAVSVDAWATSLPCTASKTNATTIVLTHASCSTTGRKLRYAWGFQGVTGLTPPTITDGLIVDNSSLAVPLTYESDFTVT